MSKITKFSLFLLLGLALLATAGCSAPKPAALTDEQVSSIASNAMWALNANDYPRFVRNFSDQMKSGFTEEQFAQLHDLLQSSSGNFISLGKINLSNAQGYAIYRFACEAERETVTMTITFQIGGQKVEGLFFDSNNLRKGAE